MDKTKNKVKDYKMKYFPSSFLIILGLIFLVIFASWIGAAISNKITHVGFLDAFTYVWRGFVARSEVILFIFAVGGILGIMVKIKAIDNGIERIVQLLGDKVLILIPVLMLIFGLGGSTYGMCEETIAFIPVLMPIFIKAKFGPFVPISVILIGAGVGCLASTVNPFAIGTAVSAAKDTKAISGVLDKFGPSNAQVTRWICFIIFEAVAISFVTWMAKRYKNAHVQNLKTENQAKELIRDQKSTFMQRFTFSLTRPKVVEGLNERLIQERFLGEIHKEEIVFTRKQKVSLSLFILGFAIMILSYLPWGIMVGDKSLAIFNNGWAKYMWWFASSNTINHQTFGFATLGNWYFISSAALFLIITLVIFAINFKDFKTTHENSEQSFISEYMKGVKMIVPVCLIIALAGGLGIILDFTGFGPLIARSFSEGIKSLVLFGIIVFLLSMILSFFVPSTSGFSSAFIPIFAQTAVMAFPDKAFAAVSIVILGFIFASGIINLISPTAASLIAYTGYAGIPFNVWLKETWKISASFFVVSIVIITIVSIMTANGVSLL